MIYGGYQLIFKVRGDTMREEMEGGILGLYPAVTLNSGNAKLLHISTEFEFNTSGTYFHGKV